MSISLRSLDGSTQTNIVIGVIMAILAVPGTVAAVLAINVYRQSNRAQPSTDIEASTMIRSAAKRLRTPSESPPPANSKVTALFKVFFSITQREKQGHELYATGYRARENQAADARDPGARANFNPHIQAFPWEISAVPQAVLKNQIANTRCECGVWKQWPNASHGFLK